MPSIVVTPKYNPFTFDELYRPLAETTKMQMALEDQYNAMEMEAAKLDYLQKSDPDAYAVVKNYENTLRGLAGELASNGLTPQSRQGVYDMRKMYSSDINPINKYITWREAQDKARQEIMMKDPTYRWEIPLDQIKYNNWKDNPDMLFRGTSGDALAKMAQTSIQHITKKWREDADFQKLNTIGLEDYWQKIENYGLNVEDMLTLRKAIENSSKLTDTEKKVLENKMNKAAIDIRDQVINSTDIPQWSNYKDLEDSTSPLSMWVNSNIERGLWAGIGDQKDQVLHDANAEGKTGQGTPTEIQDANHNWRWLTGDKNPTFLSTFGNALWVGNNFKKGFNNFVEYASKLANTQTGLNYVIQNALPYDVSTTGFNEFIKNNVADLTPTNAGETLNKALKTFGFGTNATFDNGMSLDFTGEGPKKQYQEFIDKELEKKDSKIIRRVEGNDRDNTEKFAHKVQVPALIAMTKQLDAAGNDNEKRNIILAKYASMPLDRLEEIEIIDDNKYKGTYSTQDISNLLGGDNVSFGKISKAYDDLHDFMEGNIDSDDAAAFAIHLYQGDNSQLKQVLLDKYKYDRKAGTTDMNTYDYKWDENKKDFIAEQQKDGISFEALDKAKSISIHYSTRGIFFDVTLEDGNVVKVQYSMNGNNRRELNKKLNKIKQLTTDFKNDIIENKPEEEWSNEDIKAYYMLQRQIKGLYSDIDTLIANDMRTIKAEEEKK